LNDKDVPTLIISEPQKEDESGLSSLLSLSRSPSILSEKKKMRAGTSLKIFRITGLFSIHKGEEERKK
jgi:hypothetical protein